MLKGKFYIFLIGMFLMGLGCAIATSRRGFPVYKKSYYTSMKADLTKDNNDTIFSAIDVYQRHPEAESAFQLCIGSYVCGNASIREVMEEELSGIEDVLDIAKKVDSGRYGW
jgi:hypothetical protein